MELFNLIDADGKTLCEGVVMSDGRVVGRWIGQYSSIVIHKTIDDFAKISGSHSGRQILMLYKTDENNCID